MYGNPYINTYNPQSSVDRINTQIAELEKLKSQIPQTSMQQPTNLTQNFQIAPNNNDVIKYADSIEDVEKNMVLGDTPYFSKDMSVLWIKNTKGEIKTYEINEVIIKDDKDLMIESLQMQIEELKKEKVINNEPSYTDVNESIETKKSTNVSNARTSKK